MTELNPAPNPSSNPAAKGYERELAELTAQHAEQLRAIDLRLNLALGAQGNISDAFKFAAARSLLHLADVIDMVNGLDTDDAKKTAAILLVQHVATNLLDHEIAKLPEPQYYTLGHPVVSPVELGLDCACVHYQVWHPHPDNEINRPQELPPAPCPAGGQHRLFVLGPGEIETRHEAVAR
ncbi:hypothetical protein ACJH6H_26520 [Mycobacterium sp. SMC-21]|uniref:hypothetical protein n=1 Tax=Mycobacterium sp. SMC-21 TaxID=3381632 RepID=UPI0038772486